MHDRDRTFDDHYDYDRERRVYLQKFDLMIRMSGLGSSLIREIHKNNTYLKTRDDSKRTTNITIYSFRSSDHTV